MTSDHDIRGPETAGNIRRRSDNAGGTRIKSWHNQRIIFHEVLQLEASASTGQNSQYSIMPGGALASTEPQRQPRRRRPSPLQKGPPPPPPAAISNHLSLFSHHNFHQLFLSANNTTASLHVLTLRRSHSHLTSNKTKHSTPPTSSCEAYQKSIFRRHILSLLLPYHHHHLQPLALPDTHVLDLNLPTAAMPNWKSYESSVRLLSAIIAAHPTLKLDYGEVGRFYGDGAKYKSVWGRMSVINKNAKAIAAAVEAGQDPFAVPLDDTQTSAKSDKTQGIHGCCFLGAPVRCKLQIFFYVLL
ncbi:hypothetical protein WAI453_002530 [Rhynchosporium graminicola]